MLDSLDIPLQKGLSCPVCRHQGMDNFCVKTKEPNNTTPTTKTSVVFSYTPIEEDSAGINDLITHSTVWELGFAKLHFW